MSYDQIKTVAAKITTDKTNPGFDQLKVSAVAVNRMGIRIAQSTVCRENVYNESSYLNVQGVWQGRESQFSISASERHQAPDLTATLLDNLRKQSENKEYRAPITGKGSFSWDIAKGSFSEVYAPEIIYPIIEKYASKVRSHGLRLTGYIECEETKAHSFFSSGMDLATHDHGMSFSVTVDNESTGTTGATQRGVAKTTPAEFDETFGQAVEEALTNACNGNDPGELEPGNYTVVLHPACVEDIVYTAMMYGLFDKRKIDENRTYLSKAKDELKFPEGFYIHQDLSINRPGLSYMDCPFNRDGVECDSLKLIDQGQISDLHISRFWAEQTGGKETFSISDGPPLVAGVLPGSPLSGKYKTTQDLIKGTEQGIYICNTWYLRMVAEMQGIITGMTRDGIFEIKDGKIIRPIKNMRWHENPFRILSAIDAVTDNGITFGRSRLAGNSRYPLAWMPAARVNDFHFSSVTKF